MCFFYKFDLDPQGVKFGPKPENLSLAKREILQMILSTYYAASDKCNYDEARGKANSDFTRTVQARPHVLNINRPLRRLLDDCSGLS